MNDVYNVRVGDMLYNDKAYRGDEMVKSNIIAIIYK